MFTINHWWVEQRLKRLIFWSLDWLTHYLCVSSDNICGGRNNLQAAHHFLELSNTFQIIVLVPSKSDILTYEVVVEPVGWPI